MKMGVRTPNLKKSIKARTTGKMKRALKKSVNPLYGKKGMGMINDPKKAVYNKVYNKTTVSVAKVAGVNTSKPSSSASKKVKTENKSSKSGIEFLVGLSFIASIIFFIAGKFAIGIFLLIIMVLLALGANKK